MLRSSQSYNNVPCMAAADTTHWPNGCCPMLPSNNELLPGVTNKVVCPVFNEYRGELGPVWSASKDQT